MPAILITLGIKYVCDLGSKENQICLQFQFRQGSYMPRKCLKDLEIDRHGSKNYLKKSRLQAYLVPISTKIASIVGFPPIFYQVPPYISTVNFRTVHFRTTVHFYTRQNFKPDIFEIFLFLLLIQSRTVDKFLSIWCRFKIDVNT